MSCQCHSSSSRFLPEEAHLQYNRLDPFAQEERSVARTEKTAAVSMPYNLLHLGFIYAVDSVFAAWQNARV